MPGSRSLPAVAVLAVFVPLAFASCGSGKGAGAPSDLSPAAKVRWDEYCAARNACLPAGTCPPSTCPARVVEEGPLLEFLDCQSAKACGANDDECVASAGTTDAERQAFLTRCQAAVLSYQQMPQPIPSSCYLEPVFCEIVSYPLIRKEFMVAAEACFTVPCVDLMPCLDAALEPLGCF